MKKPSPPVVIKWRRAQHANHYVGSRKIAYAGFMTAMMAFFMVMWMSGATTQQQREQIADYFKMPLKEAITHNGKFNMGHIPLVQEGLRIEIIDSKKRPMFATGGTAIAPYMRSIMRIIAPVLNDLPNRISLAGHTDNQPYLKRRARLWQLGVVDR